MERKEALMKKYYFVLFCFVLLLTLLYWYVFRSSEPAVGRGKSARIGNVYLFISLFV